MDMCRMARVPLRWNCHGAYDLAPNPGAHVAVDGHHWGGPHTPHMVAENTGCNPTRYGSLFTDDHGDERASECEPIGGGRGLPGVWGLEEMATPGRVMGRTWAVLADVVVPRNEYSTDA